MALEAERIAKLAPTFSREEHTELWNAVAQYIENHDSPDHADEPVAAKSARDKPDLFISKASS